MRRTLLFVSAALSALSLATAGCAAGGVGGQHGRTLRPFRSDAEFERFVRRLASEYVPPPPPPPQPPMPAPPPPPTPPMAPGVSPAPPLPPPTTMPASAEAATLAGKVAGAQVDESITNVQHAGVDEGGIVKVHGDFLVILRRGRVFTVRIGANALQPVSAVDAFGPGIDPRGAWYDELLVSGDQVVVIGYSYQRGGTEVGLFRIDPRGRLTHRGTWQLRSADYYSSRNYASRLVGGKLVFYAPLPLRLGARDPFESFPAFRRWDGDGRGAWRRTATATRVYRPAGELSYNNIEVRPLGPNHALVVGHWRVMMRETGQPRTGIFSLTYQRTPQGWRIIHDHSS